jgi:hypothetical protein
MTRPEPRTTEDRVEGPAFVEEAQAEVVETVKKRDDSQPAGQASGLGGLFSPPRGVVGWPPKEWSDGQA